MRKGPDPPVDIWPKDTCRFLEIKSPAGDERRKADDADLLIYFPDLLWKEWLITTSKALFDPLDVKNVQDGKNSEDSSGEEFDSTSSRLES